MHAPRESPPDVEMRPSGPWLGTEINTTSGHKDRGAVCNLVGGPGLECFPVALDLIFSTQIW